MDAPQSPSEVQPVIDALRSVDPRLDVRWEPRAIVVSQGSYDALGRMVAPVYDGRWEVILHDTSAKTADWRPHTRICLVTAPAPDAPAGTHALTHNGPYVPVGDWLVDHIRAIDRANTATLAAVHAAIDADHTRRQLAADTRADAALRDAAGRQFDDGVREAGVAQFHPVRIALPAPPRAPHTAAVAAGA